MSTIHDQLSDLHRRHGDAWNKYTYFILAITTASIAFALQRSEGATWGWGLSPLALSLLLWAGSFYCGISEVRQSTKAIGANYSMLQLVAGNHPNQPSNPAHIEPAKQGIAEAINSIVRRAKVLHVWQLRLYMYGAVSYMVWHFMRVAGAGEI